jgi:hypothetical protein
LPIEGHFDTLIEFCTLDTLVLNVAGIPWSNYQNMIPGHPYGLNLARYPYHKIKPGYPYEIYFTGILIAFI